MKHIIVLIILVALALPLFAPGGREVVGRIRITSADLSAELYGTPVADCGCCPILWNGGIVSTLADLSPVQVGDMAKVTTLDGGRYVLECAEIVPCIRFGCYLVGWRGVVSADGDIIVFSAGRAYRFIWL